MNYIKPNFARPRRPEPRWIHRRSTDQPTTIAEITPEWLSATLRLAGTITSDTEVISIHSSPIGTRQAFFGQLARLGLTYSHPDAAPLSMIAKVSRRIPLLEGATQREGQFYRLVAAQHSLSVPRCYASTYDADTGTGVLLLEDLTPLRTVDFALGASAADVETAVVGLASWHGAMWNQPESSGAPHFFTLDSIPFAELWARFPEHFARFSPSCSLRPSIVALGDRLAGDLDLVTERLQEPPLTLIHGDPHIDNFLFADSSAHPPVVLLDWQFVGSGQAATDVGYLLASSLPVAIRRREEAALLETYHRHLADFTPDRCDPDRFHRGYRLSAFVKLAMTVAATVLTDSSDSHRQAWRRADMERLVAFADDHDPIGALDS